MQALPFRVTDNCTQPITIFTQDPAPRIVVCWRWIGMGTRSPQASLNRTPNPHCIRLEIYRLAHCQLLYSRANIK